MTTEPLAFQDLILTLHKYWGDQGCASLQPYDIEVGAGTLHPAQAPPLCEYFEVATTNAGGEGACRLFGAHAQAEFNAASKQKPEARDEVGMMQAMLERGEISSSA